MQAVGPLAEFRDLTVSYGPLQALAGVTGRFLPGATGLLGPNGAGKTTLLKALLGFLRPDSGSLSAFGVDPNAQPLEVRRRIGYMPEADAHIAGMHAFGLVAYAGELSGLSSNDATSRAHEVLEYVGVGEERERCGRDLALDPVQPGDEKALVRRAPLVQRDSGGTAMQWEQLAVHRARGRSRRPVVE